MDMHYFKFYPNKDYKIKEVTQFYLYASCIERLNDPHEAEIMNLKEYKACAKEAISQCHRRVICCFSHSETNKIVWDSDYMWTRYANMHKGFCVEYNSLILNGLKPLTDKTDASSLYNIYFDVHYGPDLLMVDRIDNSHYMIDILGHKHEKWEKERETRIIFKKQPLKPERGVYSNGHLIGKLVPIKAQEKAICAIYLGRLASIKDLNSVISFANKYNIPCYKLNLTMTRIE